MDDSSPDGTLSRMAFCGRFLNDPGGTMGKEVKKEIKQNKKNDAPAQKDDRKNERTR